MNRLTIFTLGFIVSINFSAMASDLRSEVICKAVEETGAENSALEFIMQSDAVGSRKNIAVFENGFLGKQLVGNIAVPFKPEQSLDSTGFIAEVVQKYKGDGLLLEIRRLRTANGTPNGGKAELSLHGSEPRYVSLICEDAPNPSVTFAEVKSCWDQETRPDCESILGCHWIPRGYGTGCWPIH